MSDLPLGKSTDYPDRYAPDQLYPIARTPRPECPLPMHGEDLWNAWELTWLAAGGAPQVAVAEIRVPADSPQLIESKSLKLYLNSFAMSEYGGADELVAVIRGDLSAAAGADVRVQLFGPDDAPVVQSLPGDCIDSLNPACDRWEIAPDLLRADASDAAEEVLHTHLLRSLCPVTNQPDSGSLLIDYAGPRIDRAALLRYIVSFRRHNDFHEACVERIFADIASHCRPARLSVHARYQRRGGIDINPYRSSQPGAAENLRLARQ